MRIVCDTNVLVSGVLFNGPPRRILERVALGKIENAISLEILAEAKDVLARPKFGLSSEQVAGIIETFTETFMLVAPVERVRVVENDPDDDRILEAARAAKADLIISGDKHLLSLGIWSNVEIISPAVFMERHGNG
ncbi:MAG: putative toxin-antitoxin system toxin component, PIN family [Verrucomicrobiota bacterium]|nr:putative toxin-antitoxin system toxin component, PIN family [Verrucomicrobiota bacterium]